MRHSTEAEEQENSLENQISHYKELITSNPLYELAGVYHDFGISGFKEQRSGFHEMMKAAKDGNYMQSDEAGSSFYPSKSARKNGEYKVNLIGHSNGGLVSRYFIENLGGSSKVDKLITIDTPHWGSGLADINDTVATCYPMDIDLNPKNMIFGGERRIYKSLNPMFKKKLEYINSYQTDELKYWKLRNTEYYFLSGYDIEATSEIPSPYINQSISFSLDLNRVENFGDYKEKYRNSYINIHKRETNNVLLDKSAESLIDLWEWFEGHIEYQKKTEQEIQEELIGKPDWIRDIILNNTDRLTLLTMALAEDIAIYFSDTLIYNHPEVYWGYRSKPKKLDGVNQPILLGFRGDISVNPRNLVSVCICRSNRKKDKHQLYETYEIWERQI